MFAPQTRILIADDMMTMRKIVIKCLKELGYTDVQDAADGNIAWDLLQKSSPPIQLVISDWNMPNCSGLEFLRRVRTDPTKASIPFMMLTAEVEKQQVIEAIKAGVTNYCIKPFTPDIFRQKLEETYKKATGAK